METDKAKYAHGLVGTIRRYRDAIELIPEYIPPRRLLEKVVNAPPRRKQKEA